MAKFHLTQRRLKNRTHPKQGCDEYTDDKTPLQLRVSKNCKSYACRFSIKGRKVRITIAEFDDITLKDARKKALKMESQAKKGTLKIPGKDNNRRRNITFKEYAMERMAIRAKQTKSLDAFKNDEGRLRLHIIPTLGASKKIRDITIANIKKLWEYIDFGGQCINFPTSKTGAKRTFIGKVVVEILRDIHQDNGSPNNGYVFP